MSLSSFSDLPTADPPLQAPGFTAPRLRRRLACLLYEGVLLFGVVMIAAYLYSSLTQQRHALQGRHGLQAFLFLIFGIYFAWFWSQGRQTVAMRTWHIALLTNEGKPLSQARAAWRYVLSYLWFVPGLAVAWWSGLKGAGMLLPLFINLIAMALYARFAGDKQFLHDKLAGTSLISLPTKADKGT
jgi:uncharacterized RDD family membrane protein YckC